MENVKKGIQYVVYALIFVQIGLGIYWIFRNFMNIPCFGDSTEYIKLSESLQIDEYRRMCYRSVGAYFPCISVIFDGLFFR